VIIVRTANIVCYRTAPSISTINSTVTVSNICGGHHQLLNLFVGSHLWELLDRSRAVIVSSCTPICVVIIVRTANIVCYRTAPSISTINSTVTVSNICGGHHQLCLLVHLLQSSLSLVSSSTISSTFAFFNISGGLRQFSSSIFQVHFQFVSLGVSIMSQPMSVLTVVAIVDTIFVSSHISDVVDIKEDRA